MYMCAEAYPSCAMLRRHPAPPPANFEPLKKVPHPCAHDHVDMHTFSFLAWMCMCECIHVHVCIWELCTHLHASAHKHTCARAHTHSHAHKGRVIAGIRTRMRHQQSPGGIAQHDSLRWKSHGEQTSPHTGYAVHVASRLLCLRRRRLVKWLRALRSCGALVYPFYVTDSQVCGSMVCPACINDLIWTSALCVSQIGLFALMRSC